MTSPKRIREKSLPGKHWITVLAVSGLAVAAAVTWGGLAAVSTVAKVDAATERAVSQLGPVPGLASVSGNIAGPLHHGPAQPAPDGGQPGTLPEPARDDNPAALGAEQPAEQAPGIGNKAEVSLSAAANAEPGPAVAARRDGRDRSSGLAEQAPVDPAAALGSQELSLGGCLPQYGDAGQCLPAVPPSLSRHFQDMKSAGLDPGSMAHDWTCAEVRDYFPNGLTVRQISVDPQKLDQNDDGRACGPGD